MTSKSKRALLMMTVTMGLTNCAGAAVHPPARATTAARDPSAPVAPDAHNRIEIEVTEEGFRPAELAVQKGQPVTLVFTRRTEKTCLKEVIVYLDDRNRIQLELPLGQPVEVQTTFPTTGELGYSCGMKMYGGSIRVQ